MVDPNAPWPVSDPAPVIPPVPPTDPFFSKASLPVYAVNGTIVGYLPVWDCLLCGAALPRSDGPVYLHERFHRWLTNNLFTT